MDNDDNQSIIVKGKMLWIEFAIRKDGTSPGKAFFASLHQRDQANLLKFFEYFANNGEASTHNEKLFKRERPPIYSFKRKTKYGPSGGIGLIRLPCFRREKRWIITHGFWKPPKSQWPESAFTEAIKIMNEVLSMENSQ